MHLHPSCGCGCCQVRAGDGSEVVLALSSVYCDRLKNMLRRESKIARTLNSDGDGLPHPINKAIN